MQTPTDTAVGAVLEMAPRDPEGALKRAREVAREADCPSGRVRAHAAVMKALGILGRNDEALKTYNEALTHSSRASRMALAELELEAAWAQLFGRDNCDKACAHHDQCLAYLDVAMARASGNLSEGGRRKLRHLQTLQAKAECQAGMIALRKGDTDRAHRAGLAMREISADKWVQCSAVTLIAAAAFALPGVSEERLRQVLDIVDRTEETLTRSDPPVHKIKLRWTRGSILARLGELLEAEKILERVTGLLRAHGYHRDAEKAEDDLQWVRDRLRERSGWERAMRTSSSAIFPR